MTTLALLLLAASLALALANALRVPVIPMLMFSGLGLGASGVVSGDPLVADALGLGLAFLVFSSGIELNPARFGPQRRAVPWVAGVQFVVAGTGGVVVSMLLGFEAMTALYIGFALAASSTLVVVRQLKQQQQMFEPFGRLVLGVLLVQDVFIILVLVLVAGLDAGKAELAMRFGWLILMGGAALGVQKFLMPWILHRLRPDDEMLLVGAMALLFIFAGGAVYFHLPLVAGAFLAGFALSAPPVNGVVRGVLKSIGDFFLALFFTALGALVVVPEWDYLIKGLVLALFVIVVTPPVVTAVAEWTGLSSRASIESGLLLAQTSEYSMVLALWGLEGGHLNESVFSTIALVTVATMTATPFLATDAVTWKLLHWHPLRRMPGADKPPSGHVLMIGFGTGGMWVLKPLRAAGHEVVVIDDDPVVITNLLKSGIHCIRGDGSDEKVLESAGARAAKLIIVATRRAADADKILRCTKGRDVIVRTFEEADAARIRALGGVAILNSHASADSFMEWFEGAKLPAAGHAAREP